MDDILPKLLGFPPSPNLLSDKQFDEGIKAQIDTLKALQNDKHLLQRTSGGENPLDIIDPALNSVPYAFILVAYLTATKTKESRNIDIDWLWHKMARFLATSDTKQIRYLGEERAQIIDALVTFARRNSNPVAAIIPIRETILRLDPEASLLTSTHLLLVKLALEARVYDMVGPVISNPVVYFPADKEPASKENSFICDISLPTTSYITRASGLSSKLKYQDILEYSYCCGLIFIGMRNWEMAFVALEDAVTYPVRDGTCSKIMVEAYKKWILVGLLLRGKAISLPQGTSHIAAKAYHSIAKPYETIATLFESGTAARLKAEVEFGQQIWRVDCNTGLILNVLAAHLPFQIRKLADIYSKISVPEIILQTVSAETGNRLPSAEAAEGLIQSMIREGSLHATLSHPPNEHAILAFVDNVPELSEAEMQRELAATTQRMQALAREIKETDHMLTHDKEYIKYATKQKRLGKTTPGESSVNQSCMDWNPLEDEDLMTGGY